MSEPQRDGFTPDELRLGYLEWKPLSEERKPYLAERIRRWLADWEIWDFACSPMNDDERRMIRYGHYLGWWDRDQRGEKTRGWMGDRSGTPFGPAD
jgi:hypothetical protein